MTQKMKVIAAVVDTRKLTMYLEDGSTWEIVQGDPRLRKIIQEDKLPQMIETYGYAMVDMEEAAENVYTKFEEISPVVRFYRIGKRMLKKLMGQDGEETAQVTSMKVGTVPKITAAVEEIIKHAVPASDDRFTPIKHKPTNKIVDDASREHPDTVVAVVDGKAIVPGMEKIAQQFHNAYKLSSPIGIENFLRRCATVAAERSHKVEDLLRFMDRGDLAIADDGCILIYKRLKSSQDPNVFRDVHSGLVPQRVGSYVHMDPKMVDPNRHNECSQGLHVARRGYLNSFCGDVCVLAKVRPEDVIAVPNYDANKMRVCGYHILYKLNQKHFASLIQNKPMTDDEEGRTIIGNALRGNHIGIIELVKIGGPNGTKIEITTPEQVTVTEVPELQPDAQSEALDVPDAVEEVTEAPIDPKAVAKEVTQIKQTLTRQEQGKALYADYQAGKPGALETLKDFKRTSKVSWEKLGIPDPGDVLGTVAKKSEKAKPVPKKSKPKVTKVKTSEKALRKPVEAKTPTEPPAPAKKTDALEALSQPAAAPKETRSYAQQIAAILAEGPITLGTAKQIAQIKKTSKKGWGKLGVTAEQQKQIEEQLK